MPFLRQCKAIINKSVLFTVLKYVKRWIFPSKLRDTEVKRSPQLLLLHYFWLTPTWCFSASWRRRQHSIFLSVWCDRELTVRTPRDVDSHRCSYTYSNILPECQGREEEKQCMREREDYELNVDLSSAGCRSKEQHWQAEHRIHRSLLSMPSSSFSEVEEHRGAWLQARNVCICCPYVCMYVYFGGRRGVGTCTMSQGKDLAL